MNGIAVVGIGTGIDDNAVKSVPCCVQLVDDRTLVVGLEDLALQPQSLGTIQNLTVQIGEGGVSVHAGLPFAQQIQVRSMNHQYFFDHMLSTPCLPDFATSGPS